MMTTLMVIMLMMTILKMTISIVIMLTEDNADDYNADNNDDGNGDNDDDNADNDDDDNGDQGASGRRHSELEAVANHKHWRQEFHVVNR